MRATILPRRSEREERRRPVTGSGRRAAASTQGRSGGPQLARQKGAIFCISASSAAPSRCQPATPPSPATWPSWPTPVSRPPPSLAAWWSSPRPTRPPICRRRLPPRWCLCSLALRHRPHHDHRERKSTRAGPGCCLRASPRRRQMRTRTASRGDYIRSDALTSAFHTSNTSSRHGALPNSHSASVLPWLLLRAQSRPGSAQNLQHPCTGRLPIERRDQSFRSMLGMTGGQCPRPSRTTLIASSTGRGLSASRPIDRSGRCAIAAATRDRRR